MRHEFDVNNNDHSLSYFMPGQALCLRALCRYEEHEASTGANSLKIREVDNNEDTYRLLEKILNFIMKSDSKVGMRWQFKSHHNHLESELIHNQFQSDMIDQCFVKNYWIVMEEVKSNKKLERMFSYINKKTGRKTGRDSAAYAIVNPFDAYYVISPDKSLRQDQCQEKSGLAKYLEKKLRLD
ncbi:hypothetical protein Tco_0869688, partial [Tanacetum coccineum]